MTLSINRKYRLYCHTTRGGPDRITAIDKMHRKFGGV